MRMTLNSHSVLVLSLLMASPYLSGSTITYSTPAGATTLGGAVNASATFTATAGVLTITLRDLLANPTDAAQLVSDVDFALSSALTGTPTFSSLAQQVTISSGGTATPGATGSTGWGFGSNGVGYTICIICPGGYVLSTGISGQPAGEIIGPGPYTNANGSIAGSPSHNPFLNQTATFTITNTAITSNTVVSNVIFSFGTTPGVNVQGVPDGGGGVGNAVPEPGSASLFAIGSLGLLVSLKKLTSANGSHSKS